jgi:hypothetical protein
MRIENFRTEPIQQQAVVGLERKWDCIIETDITKIGFPNGRWVELVYVISLEAAT